MDNRVNLIKQLVDTVKEKHSVNKSVTDIKVEKSRKK